MERMERTGRGRCGNSSIFGELVGGPLKQDQSKVRRFESGVSVKNLRMGCKPRAVDPKTHQIE